MWQTNIDIPNVFHIQCRGDKEEDQQRADVADEDAERGKRFDEEAGSGSCNRVIVAGSSKTGESSKHDVAGTSVAEREDLDNKNLEKDEQGKKS